MESVHHIFIITDLRHLGPLCHAYQEPPFTNSAPYTEGPLPVAKAPYFARSALPLKQGFLLILWRRCFLSLQKFPELKFKYVEEEQPEEFFIPYVWSLVYKSSTLYWNADHIQLFHPESEETGF